MKNIVYFYLFIMLFSCNQIPKEERVLLVEDSDLVHVINVPKAGCRNCQKIIEGGLKDVKGVKQSILNLQTKEVSIVYSPNATSQDIIEKKVQILKGNLPCK